MSAPSTVAIRPATADDLALTSAWQTMFLPYGLFPQLGERFVRRWHATFLDPPYGVALIAEQETVGGRVPVGFLLGSTDQHRARLGPAGLAALARGSGAGRALVDSFLAQAWTAGVPLTELVVMAGPGGAEALEEYVRGYRVLWTPAPTATDPGPYLTRPRARGVQPRRPVHNSRNRKDRAAGAGAPPADFAAAVRCGRAGL